MINVVSRLIFSLTILTCLVTSVTAVGCPIAPMFYLPMNIDRIYEESDVVFLGKLVKLREASREIELAGFHIDQVFKGIGAPELTVQNDFRSDCGSSFKKGESYYVFGKNDPNTGLIVIEGHKTFISDSEAAMWELEIPPSD